jgi:outer membrane protein assembly factor BamB
LILTIALAGCSSSVEETTTGASKPVPSKAAWDTGDDPYAELQISYPNVDQANTRNAPSTLEVANVPRLAPVWSRPIEGEGEGGEFIATPLITDDVAYMQDLSSNVAAIDLADGKTLWEKRYDVPALGPNGLSVSRGFEMVFGATPTEAFGLEEETGKEIWSVRLARPGTEIGMAPAYCNGLTLVAARPTGAGADGTLWALDNRSGNENWRVEKVSVTHTPACDIEGSIFVGTANSLLRLDESTGKPAWRYRVAPSGTQNGEVGAPLFAKSGGRNLVVAASENGTVVALDRETGKPLWQRSLRGGVTGPLSLRESTLFVPVLEGELAALDLFTGKVKWRKGLGAPVPGPALATNDLVFALSADGRVHAFAAGSGKEVWSEKVASSAEGGLAAARGTLLVRAGSAKAGDAPRLIAFRLGG